MKQSKVAVSCPKCGHTQPEPSTAYSTRCKGCGEYYRVQDALRPAPAAPPPALEIRRVTCFKCQSELEVPASAQSTMCKRCSAHMDLRDYHITNAVSKNFATKGRFVIDLGGYVFNTECFVTNAVIKGRFLGKLVVEESLEIHSSAEIKGVLQPARLVIPAGSRFAWPQKLHVGSADIHGELVAPLVGRQTIHLHPGSRMFGDIEAAHLIVDDGAVWVGRGRIGQPMEEPAPPAPPPPPAEPVAHPATRTTTRPPRSTARPTRKRTSGS